MYEVEVLHATYGGYDTAANRVITPITLFTKRQSPTCMIGEVQFSTERCAETYALESVEVVNPAGDDAHSILLYDSGESAAVAYFGDHRTIVMGFPIEAITDDATRNRAMAKSLYFLLEQKRPEPKPVEEIETTKRGKRNKRNRK